MIVIWKLFGLKSALSMSAADCSVVLMMRFCLLSEHVAITTKGFDYVVYVFGTKLICNIYNKNGYKVENFFLHKAELGQRHTIPSPPRNRLKFLVDFSG